MRLYFEPEIWKGVLLLIIGTVLAGCLLTRWFGAR
jgi:hypothetical protein